jgi:hypothetical protein
MPNKATWLIVIVGLMAAFAFAIAAGPAAPKPAGPPANVIAFEKVRISDEDYESAAALDANNDGQLDIVCGGWWYPGPKFDKKCPVAKIRRDGDYWDDFATIALDCNGDGYADVVTGGWFSQALRWRENPKGDPAKEWPEHVIAQVGNVETVCACDLDGDGQPEIVPDTPNSPLKVFKLVMEGGKGAGKVTEHLVYDGSPGFGLGFGDVSGDGRVDIVIQKGWLEAPAKPLGGEKWVFHPDFDIGDGSIPILVADVNGDGRADLIVGQGHRYGLDWWEQKADGDKRQWIKHPIDPASSQYHAMVWTDIDGDGRPELVTGKRRHAHRDGDPGDHDPAGVYYFKWTGEGFAKQVIDYGLGPAGKGCGIFFQVVDVDKDGRPDVVAPGKDGLVLYRNLGVAR